MSNIQIVLLKISYDLGYENAISGKPSPTRRGLLQNGGFSSDECTAYISGYSQGITERQSKPATPRGFCLVLASPSGGGKTTMAERLIAEYYNMTRSISATTRPPRKSEQHGLDYYFYTPQAFDKLVNDGDMLEHSTVFGNSYGIPRQPVEDALAAGRVVVLVLDYQGYHKLSAELPGDVVGVFLTPPSMQELERRMVARGDSAEAIRKRMDGADQEMIHRHDFEHEMVNKEIQETMRKLGEIVLISTARRLGIEKAAIDCMKPSALKY